MISAVSRDARQNVFITERHIRPNRLGRESPKVDSRWGALGYLEMPEMPAIH